MSEYIITDIDGAETRVKKPADGTPALITDYGKLDDYIEMHKKHYDEKRAAFFDSLPADRDLPKKAKRWASVSRIFMGLARTLMRIYGEGDKYQQTALEIADRITKESGIRAKNLELHYELMKQQHPNEEKMLDRISKDVEDGLNFMDRAIATQSMLLEQADEESGGAAGAELEMERKASKRSFVLKGMVPAGHAFYPARPFPETEIPEGLRVPFYPQPYERMKELDPEDLVFDEEHDEFIIRPGYVSEDGLIDDESVVWNWEEGTVTIKFRGGEPEVWPFWKPKDAADIPKGWCARYLRRVYVQWRRSLERKILSRRLAELPAAGRG